MLYPDKKPAVGIPMSISVTGITASGRKIQLGKAENAKDGVNFEDTTDNQGRANFVIDVPGDIKAMKMRVRVHEFYNLIGILLCTPKLSLLCFL